MPDHTDYYLPGSDHLLTFRPPPPLAMHLRATGEGAEADIRQFCSGQMPHVGQRYVLVCTAVSRAEGAITVAFHLVPLETPPSEEEEPHA